MGRGRRGDAVAPRGVSFGEASRRLLVWFARNARTMEWRQTADPYRIWVSEIMLQQTRVETAAPYYRRFLEAFPTLDALAGASPDDVLKAWEGLGYYSRARNLHRAAKAVLRDFGGEVPSTVDGLASLPGVGRSTAGAIAAIAFRRDAPILDANARRVLARLLALRGSVSGGPAARRLWKASRGLIAPGTGRETALALMDLGATVCVPRRPACGACPLAGLCAAFRYGLQEAIPERPSRKEIPHRDLVAAVIEDREGKVFIDRRPAPGLLGGLWEFPGGRCEPGEPPHEALAREIRNGWGMTIAVRGRFAPIRHAYSHFRVTVHAFRCVRRAGKPGPGAEWRWVAPAELGSYAFPGVCRKLIDAAFPAAA